MNVRKLLIIPITAMIFPLGANAQRGFGPTIIQFSTPIGPIGSKDTFQIELAYPDTLQNLSVGTDPGIILQETGQYDDLRNGILYNHYNLIVKVDSLMCWPALEHSVYASGSNFSAWAGVNGYVFDPHLFGKVHCDTKILNFGNVQVGATSNQDLTYTLDTFGALRYLFPLNIDSPFFSAGSIPTNSPCDDLDNYSSFSFDPTEVKKYIDTVYVWDPLGKDSTSLILEGEGVATDSVAEERSNATSLSIFPNPSEGECTIALSNSQLETINFYTPLGDLVYSVQPAEGSSATVNTAKLSNGIYFVEVVSGDRLYRSRLIVDH